MYNQLSVLCWLMLLVESNSELCDVGNHLMPHEVMDADRRALAFLHTDGPMLALILMKVDTWAQGIAFFGQCKSLGIGQGIANGVTSRKAFDFVVLLYGKHDVLIGWICRCAKSDVECSVDVCFSFW